MEIKTLFPLFAYNRVYKSVQFLTQIYEENQRTLENQHLFDEFINILSICIKIMMLNFVCLMTTVVCSPLIAYIFFSDAMLEPILPYYIPGTGPNSYFALNIIHQLYGSFIGLAKYISFDILFAVQCLHIILLTKILRNKIRAINQMLTARKQNHFEIMVNFRNIIELHKEMLA